MNLSPSKYSIVWDKGSIYPNNEGYTDENRYSKISILHLKFHIEIFPRKSITYVCIVGNENLESDV